MPKVTAAIEAENNFTSGLLAMYANAGYLKMSTLSSGYLNLSISGSFDATVTLQRQFGDDSGWFDVSSFTAPIEKSLNDYEEDVMYRVGVKTGDYVSGTVNVRLSK